MEKERIRRIADYYRGFCAAEGVSLQPLPEGGEMAKECCAALEAGEEIFEDMHYYTAFWIAVRSSFLQGGGRRKWRADFLWLITPKNMRKVLEGQYTPQLDEYDRIEMRSMAKLMTDPKL